MDAVGSIAVSDHRGKSGQHRAPQHLTDAPCQKREKVPQKITVRFGE